MKTIASDLWHIIAASFSGKNIFVHLLAIGLTAVIVLSGFDWFYFVHLRGVGFNAFFFPAVAVGGIIPIILPLTLFVFAKIFRRHRVWNLGFALGLAALAGSIVSSTYKALTGRMPPDHYGTVMDISHQFNFGLLEHGVFWGWPSSHTTIAFAMAFTLITLYPKNKWLKYISFIYALYVGIAVSMSIHWFSEFIAGALIGTVIGISTGKLFKGKLGR